MKKILIILMIGLFLYSCEKEEEPKIYTNLGEMLKDIDEECAYQIYLKDSVDLKKWIDTLTVDSKYDLNSRYYFDVLLVALHETNHMINARLSGVNTEIYITCNGTYGRNSVGYATPDNYNFTLFSYGNIFVTGLDYKSNIIETNIISETIPHKNFKNDYIYKFYIENNGKPQNLLDEWNSFNVQDNYFIKYNDIIECQNYYKGKNGNTIKFMLYLQCYLKSARLKYQYTYDQIKNNSELIELIQFLWLKSEETLDNGFDLINLNKQYFEYMYSDDFLQELDSLGIQHQNMKHWKKTYMNEKYPNYF